SVSALSLAVAKRTGWLQIVKKQAPLRKPLDQLTLGADSPYRLSLQPALSGDMEHELGTHDYAGWRVEDSRASEQDPSRHGAVFVTYYTGKPDQVPHVAEECLQQGGMQLVEDNRITMEIPELGAGERGTVRMRSLLFRRPHDVEGQRVFYFFSCNGDFYDNRDSVRTRMMNFREQSLYYSKVDLSFSVDLRREPKAELTEKAREYFRVFIPLLAREHWPDWNEVMRKQTGG